MPDYHPFQGGPGDHRRVTPMTVAVMVVIVAVAAIAGATLVFIFADRVVLLPSLILSFGFGAIMTVLGVARRK
jgi:hypothetical protein